MATDWEPVKLGDIVDLQTGFPFKSERYTEDADDPRLLRGDNVIQGRLRWDGVQRWPRALASEYPGYELRPGDVVLAMDRPWIEAGLKYARIIQEDLPSLLVQRVARLRAKEPLDQTFLHYVIGSRAFTEYVLCVQTGTSIPHISGGQIRNFKFPLPPVSEQQRIARVLRTLDDKIELNRWMNHTLEALARALFQSWFVDFDPVTAKAAGRRPAGMTAETARLFPKSFEDSPLGLIPKGWTFKTIGEVVVDVYDGPHATPPEAPCGAIFLGIKNLTGTQIDLSEIRRIGEADWPRWTRRVVPGPGDIVFTYEATLGFFALVPPNLRCCLGRRLALVRPKRDVPGPHFLFHSFISEPFHDMLMAKSVTGSTVNRIPLLDFPKYGVVWPPKDLREAFERAACVLWRRIHENQSQIRNLIALRDALLPRLLSGELRSKEAETLAEIAPR